MTTAILYIRVSTDEQAQKGYSQRIQHERLIKHCELNQIDVIQIVYEDYSAKTFRRPEWSQLLKALTRAKTNRPDQILFTRWDRFSRNAADAYYMIEKLKSLNVHPTATDQPLDLTIPENKIMLAIYLATSEVENDRRSLNVKQGIHKAKQEGRCTNRPPKGYRNITLADGTKSIIIVEPDGTFIKDIFETIATSHESIQAIHRSFIKMGWVGSLNNLWLLIRNPFYCGKIVIPKYEQQERHIVNGLHPVIISDQLFWQVQDRLLERRRRPSIRCSLNPDFPLRGLLKCPCCGRILTGSRSKGKLKHYHYYHCKTGCRYRVRADQINELFQQKLNKLNPNDLFLPQISVALKDVYQKKFNSAHVNQVKIFQTIEQISTRLAKAKTLFLMGNIEAEDYKLIKNDCETKINGLGSALSDAAKILSQADDTIKHSVKKLSELFAHFSDYTPELKRKLIQLLCEIEISFNGVCFIKLFNRLTTIVLVPNQSNLLCDWSKIHYRNQINGIDRRSSTIERQTITFDTEIQQINKFIKSLAEITLEIAL